MTTGSDTSEKSSNVGPPEYHGLVDTETREFRKLLEQIRRTPLSRRPIRLSRSYLAAVEAWEDRPAQRSGADQSWVERAIIEYSRHYAARRSG
jgi:hypothetical protein